MMLVTKQNQWLTGDWCRRYTDEVVVNCSLTALGEVIYGAKKCVWAKSCRHQNALRKSGCNVLSMLGKMPFCG